MSEKKDLCHERLRKWEPFDKITMEVIPRYKTSGLSGDEWRSHVEVSFYFKGQIVRSFGARDMQAAIMLLPGQWITNQEPIPQEVIDLEKKLCDQPSCAAPFVGRLKLKSMTSESGQFLKDNGLTEFYDHYRQFCATHIKRGDCGREDCDDNYAPLDGKTAADSTNTEESPSGLVVMELGKKEE